MAGKHASKHQLSAWYIPVALVIFFVVLWLVLQQVSSTNLSASIDYRPPSMPKWQCLIRCQCEVKIPNTVSTIAETAGTIDVCANYNISNGDLSPRDGYSYTPVTGTFTCYDACKARGGIHNGSWQSGGSCKTIGICQASAQNPYKPIIPSNSPIFPKPSAATVL